MWPQVIKPKPQVTPFPAIEVQVTPPIGWTDAQATEIIQAYLAGITVDQLVEQTGRTKRSIIAKLVQVGVYKSEHKAPALTKTAIVQRISAATNSGDRYLTSLEHANREDLLEVMRSLEARQ
jgi:hypothetical protein